MNNPSKGEWKFCTVSISYFWSKISQNLLEKFFKENSVFRSVQFGLLGLSKPKQTDPKINRTGKRTLKILKKSNNIKFIVKKINLTKYCIERYLFLQYFGHIRNVKILSKNLVFKRIFIKFCRHMWFLPKIQKSWID